MYKNLLTENNYQMSEKLLSKKPNINQSLPSLHIPKVINSFEQFELHAVKYPQTYK